MNDKREKLLKLVASVPNRYLLRSQSVDNLLELDVKSQPTLVQKTDLAQKLNESLVTSESQEQVYSNIEDPEERDQALKEL